jgi:PAS domain S-box-containing protein
MDMTLAEKPASNPTIHRRILETLVVAALYFLAARLGLLLDFAYKNVSPVWPPSGVALAVLVATRLRAWPGVTLGALLANSSTGLPLPTAVVICIGNTLEGLAGASLLLRSTSFRPSLRRMTDVLLLMLASVASPTIAATMGAAGLALGGLVTRATYLPAWLTWWLGDAMGMLLLGSALLTWMARHARTLGQSPGELRWRIVEATALAATLAVVTHFIFFGIGKEYRYAVFPVMVWAALRFGQRGAATAVLAVAGIAVWATVRGSGPFVKLDPNLSLIYLQTFMAVVSATSLLLGAAITERAETAEALLESERRFRLALEHSDIIVYSQDEDLRYTWIYDGKHRFDPATVVGRTDTELAPEEEAAAITEVKRRVLKSGKGERREVTATTQGRTSVYDLIVEPARDSAGQVVGVSGVAHDITELKRYQNATEALNVRLQRAMTETHHRVKNNLQVIAAMVDLRLMDGADQVPAEEVKRLATVTRTLATVHDLLTKEAKEDGQAQAISARAMIENLVPMLQDTTLGRTLQVASEEVRLPAKQATSLAIIVSELVGNAIKHGSGTISITFRSQDDGSILDVTDQGPGFPPDFNLVDSAGTGLELVDNLSRWDLGGKVTCSNLSPSGAHVSVALRTPSDILAP